jgi:8-oxo-dGTP pyrophosphatase MutT (NUDIX family)
MDPEDNNNPINTAIQECKEETGLDITNLRLVLRYIKW